MQVRGSAGEGVTVRAGGLRGGGEEHGKGGAALLSAERWG